MNPLLISGFGTSINVEKRKLVIQNRLKNEKIEFYPHRISHDSIILDGHTGSISFESMRWLMKHDIHLTLLNWNGNLLATTLPEAPRSGKLRIKQYQKYQDTKTRYKIAQKIVRTKVESSLNLLKELARFYDLDIVKTEKTIQKENQSFAEKLDAENAVSFSNLLMYEGRIATVYFANLGVIFNKIAPKFPFSVRADKENNRNYNAADEINALLNYGYAILESEARKAVNASGLDYSIGFLHEIFQGKTPLVYDMQELFRWLVDYSLIKLLEEYTLKKSDFIITENYHIRLRENIAKLLIEKIRINFNRKAPYKGKNYTCQNILYDNVQQLANFVSDRRKDLEFFIPKLTIDKNDSLELRKKILKMTSDERKRLGIAKTTLWCMKKNISNKKNVKIYEKTLFKLNQK